MLDRLNRALERIEDDPGAPLDVAAMARDALTTPAHLRRTFSALAGMPLAEYARRRRLTLAGTEVRDNSGATLLDIAVRYGYGSGEAFARAFRAVHGVGPGRARRSGAVLTFQPRIAFRLTVEGSTTVDYRIVEKEAFRLIGPATQVPVIAEGRNPTIEEFVRTVPDEVTERLEALSDQEPGGLVSVTTDVDPQAEEGSRVDYRLAAATSARSAGDLPVLEEPAGTWVVFTKKARAEEYPQALQWMWADAYAQWFPSNPAYRAREGGQMLKVDYSEGGADVSAELWIPAEQA